jgi:hypothetical protein
VSCLSRRDQVRPDCMVILINTLRKVFLTIIYIACLEVIDGRSEYRAATHEAFYEYILSKIREFRVPTENANLLQAWLVLAHILNIEILEVSGCAKCCSNKASQQGSRLKHVKYCSFPCQQRRAVKLAGGHKRRGYDVMIPDSIP